MRRQAAKFLLVDDIEENLTALSAVLQREGLEILHARSGREALELLLVYDVALALIDVQMPEMDGFELAELMRGTERTRTVPIIFVTAGAIDSQRRFRGYEAGAVDFLFKPIDTHILRGKADVFFELWQKRQEVALQRDELRESENKLRLALEAADMGTWEYHFADQVCRLGPRAQALYGMPSADWRHDDAGVAAVVHPDDIAGMRQALTRAAQSPADGRYRTEYRVRQPEGGWRWLSVWGLVQFGEEEKEGVPVVLVGASRDITDEKNYAGQLASTAEKLAERTRELDAILSSVQDYLYIVDAGGRFIFANKKLLAVWRLEPGQVLGRTMRELGHPESVEEVFRRDIEKVLRTGEVVINETAYPAPGAGRHYEHVLAPMLGPDGAVKFVAGASRDITDRKRAEESLKQADRRKDQFIAMLAHELRNPLAAIGAAAALLLRPETSPDRAELAKRSLEQRVNQLARLVDDLLDVSRITQGKIELKKEHLELATVVEQAAAAARGYFEEQKQELVVRVSGQLPVFGDPVRMQQILVNLLTNASRYSGQGAQIFVEAFPSADRAVIVVKDNGLGIPPDLLPRLFEPFIQGEESIARTRGGLGLGLAIVKSLCEMHEGGVSARSAGEGQGSEFEVWFPIVEQTREARTAKPQQTAHSPLRILLVEDHLDTAVMQAAMLELEGHTVELAHSGPAAVEGALSLRPDVILLDIGLPGFDGYEVARRVREAGLAQTTIVVLSGYGQERDIQRAYEAGADHHLLKPVDWPKLAALLSTAERKDAAAS